ncbi:MAG: CRISPR-associated helicase Cas3', partial [Rhodococcus sp. (in: high G+C Gram-positive bacteria)]
MSDWIASNDDFFPLGQARESVGTAEEMWDRLAFLPPWEAHPPEDLAALLKARFQLPDDAEPRSMQVAAVDAARAMVEPGMLVIEAAMGTGKTEAALAVAEVLAEKFGQGGVFFALPTMATSNAMFERVLGWIEAQDGLAAASAVLAHSKAALNPSYRELQSESALGLVGDDVCDHGATVIAHSWMSGRKRGLLAEFVVGTVDQLLFAALKAKHVVLRHLAFANKVVIIDEVHAADVYMREYLKRALEWLGSYRVPVILLSATLPSEQRVALVTAYQSGEQACGDLVGDIGYPVITVCQPSGVQTIDVEDTSAPTVVEISQLRDDEDALVDLLSELLAEGGCAGVVRNTVGRAQETARLLSARFPGEVTLVHSRFLAQHRSDLEADLVEQLGPQGSRPARRIVVGTQVIEQSLDIDFDVMISDMAPIDLLFQRMGRLHRHRSTVRPELVRSPRFFVTGVVDWASEPPEPITASSRIYSDVLLIRTLAVLRDRWSGGTVELPRDIAELVQLAYGENVPIPETWASEYRDATAKGAVENNRTRLEASSFLLGGPYAEDTLVNWLAENIGEADGPRGQAKVRDTDEGIEVIVTQRIGENVHLPEQCGGRVIDTDFAPSAVLSRQALTATVRLPMQLTGSWRIDQTLDELEQRCYAGWQDSKWLAGELVLELDAEGCANLAGYDIRYHPIEGLIVT